MVQHHPRGHPYGEGGADGVCQREGHRGGGPESRSKIEPRNVARNRGGPGEGDRQGQHRHNLRKSHLNRDGEDAIVREDHVHDAQQRQPAHGEAEDAVNLGPEDTDDAHQGEGQQHGEGLRRRQLAEAHQVLRRPCRIEFRMGDEHGLDGGGEHGQRPERDDDPRCLGQQKRSAEDTRQTRLERRFEDVPQGQCAVGEAQHGGQGHQQRRSLEADSFVQDAVFGQQDIADAEGDEPPPRHRERLADGGTDLGGGAHGGRERHDGEAPQRHQAEGRHVGEHGIGHRPAFAFGESLRDGGDQRDECEGQPEPGEVGEEPPRKGQGCGGPQLTARPGEPPSQRRQPRASGPRGESAQQRQDRPQREGREEEVQVYPGPGGEGAGRPPEQEEPGHEDSRQKESGQWQPVGRRGGHHVTPPPRRATRGTWTRSACGRWGARCSRPPQSVI